MWPPTKCEICGEFFCDTHSKIHCVQLTKNLENTKRELAEEIKLLSDIIEAFRDRGECKQEILNAAFAAGYSVSRKEFKWLEDEINKIRSENANRKK